MDTDPPACDAVVAPADKDTPPPAWVVLAPTETMMPPLWPADESPECTDNEPLEPAVAEPDAIATEPLVEPSDVLNATVPPAPVLCSEAWVPPDKVKAASERNDASAAAAMV